MLQHQVHQQGVEVTLRTHRALEAWELEASLHQAEERTQAVRYLVAEHKKGGKAEEGRGAGHLAGMGVHPEVAFQEAEIPRRVAGLVGNLEVVPFYKIASVSPTTIQKMDNIPRWNGGHTRNGVRWLTWETWGWHAGHERRRTWRNHRWYSRRRHHWGRDGGCGRGGVCLRWCSIYSASSGRLRDRRSGRL